MPPGNGNPFPASYNGWQLLTAQRDLAARTTRLIDICTGQCWYDEDVYTPAGLPDTVYVIGSYNYGELPCNTKGVGCGNGRSNGRAVALLDDRGRSGCLGTGHGRQPNVHRPDRTTRRTLLRPGARWVRPGRPLSAASGQRSHAYGPPTASTLTSTRSSSTRRIRPRSSRARTAA